jgi:hypothetical protein
MNAIGPTIEAFVLCGVCRIEDVVDLDVDSADDDAPLFECLDAWLLLSRRGRGCD